MEGAIENAIATKRLIGFTYNGRQRLVEPHVLGVNGGVIQVLGYKIGGSSGSGIVPDWRRFDLSAIDDLQVTAAVFSGPRPYPSGKHSPWDEVIVVVS